VIVAIILIVSSFEEYKSSGTNEGNVFSWVVYFGFLLECLISQKCVYVCMCLYMCYHYNEDGSMYCKSYLQNKHVFN
jgi:hypothetical protein